MYDMYKITIIPAKRFCVCVCFLTPTLRDDNHIEARRKQYCVLAALDWNMRFRGLG